MRGKLYDKFCNLRKEIRKINKHPAFDDTHIVDDNNILIDSG